MKSNYSSQNPMMKMAPEDDNCPSRPYGQQFYFHGSYTLSSFTFSVNKPQGRIKKANKSI
jgi:hypothetical protein